MVFIKGTSLVTLSLFYQRYVTCDPQLVPLVYAVTFTLTLLEFKDQHRLHEAVKDKLDPVHMWTIPPQLL